MKRIQAVLNKQGLPTRIWRNNVGMLYDARGIPVSFGLAKGSADLIGIHSVVIRPEDVGRIFGRFLAVEVKVPGKKPEEHQEAWLETVRRFGGETHVMTSIEEAMKLVGKK